MQSKRINLHGPQTDNGVITFKADALDNFELIAI